MDTAVKKTPELSGRARKVSPFLVMDMLREATRLEAAGSRIIHMEAGQPSGPAPALAVEAARAALGGGAIGYTESTGIAPLRERISEYYRKTHGCEVPASRIIVTTGSSAGFVLAFLAAFDPGARVGLASPGYPAYRNILTGLDLEPVDIKTTAATRWSPVPGDLDTLAARGAPLDGMLVASPANPTGTMMSRAALKDLAAACARRGTWFISDEIYHGLTYTMAPATALEFSSDVIVINSFSKYYCMTGWRIGWMVVPEHLVRAIECLSQNLYISAPTLSQVAACAAFDAGDELEERKAVYAGNRELLLDGLGGPGLGDVTPVDGAFYIYTDVSRLTSDSREFARRMLKETGIAMTPGADFDTVRGHRHLRMSFAGARCEIEDALRRLKVWLK